MIDPDAKPVPHAKEGTVTPQVFQTERGTKYLKEAGVILMAQSRPERMEAEFSDFLYRLEPEFEQYLRDDAGPLGYGEETIKVAGQACYQSFGANRSLNINARYYFENILQQKHGSVLEHAHLALWIFGISRACSHEMVRHRHLSPSQLSQRYVGAGKLRFIMHPGIQAVPTLHRDFERWIDLCATHYYSRSQALHDASTRGELDLPSGKRDQRKWITQAARMGLPNETETMMMLSGNLRAWRYFVVKRGAMSADTEIRRVAIKVCALLQAHAPNVAQDLFIRVDDETGEQYVEAVWGEV